MASNNPAFFRRELAAYGVSKASLKLLSPSASPDTVNYLDLLPDAPGGSGKVVAGRSCGKPRPPAVHVVDRARLAAEPDERELEIRQLRRVLGSRGERAYLAIVEPGQLLVIPIALSRDGPPPGVLYTQGPRRRPRFSRGLDWRSRRRSAENRTTPTTSSMRCCGC